ncbi:LacI family DNA-binding transcriptional regulator [Pleomorphomonas sp. PLEO]|uniref:LacI family DNA-binding transcriptional regulator n=1 Tax=Pleomorphomonas sp. PLEO TaxID=3239306 RepID=UPI00351ED976
MPPAPGKKTTIYDLSKLSGSSPSTVSAVLNGTWRQRRIKEATAELIKKLAEENQYSANRQARGLRNSLSGLIGLLLPIYDFHHFSSIAQAFELRARRRGLCPVVVSTHRDPAEERASAEHLISYSIDALFVCGAADPDGVHEVCKASGVRHINLDLPGTLAPSVVSDNYGGARVLTEALINAFPADAPLTADELILIGGREDDATRARIRAFHDVRATRFGDSATQAVDLIGYSARNAKIAFERHFQERGRLPRAVFINSAINFEGFLRFLTDHRGDDFSGQVIGCFDYVPFASFLSFPVIMIRQDAERMVAKAFELLDRPHEAPNVFVIPPQLVPPRTALTGPLDELDFPSDDPREGAL